MEVFQNIWPNSSTLFSVFSFVTDYVYDANGNLVSDRNKGGTESLTNGSFENGSASWTITDTGSRLTFANNEVQIITGTTTPVLSQTVLEEQRQYVVVVDMERTAGSISIGMGSTAAAYIHTLNSTGLHVLAVPSGSNGILKVTAATSFSGKIKSVSVKGVTVIGYNHLNLPQLVTRAGDKQLDYIYDATGRKLSQIVSKNGVEEKRTDYAGEFIYENDTLKIIQHEEGRIVPEGSDIVYQYHLKDHLGNVRLTFTTRDEIDTPVATLETDHKDEERAQFLKYDDIRTVDHAMFDHTNSGSTKYSMRLSGGDKETYGLAKSLSVMPGDKIRAEVYAKYVDPDQ